MGQLTIRDAEQWILDCEKTFLEVCPLNMDFKKEFQFSMQALQKNDFALNTALKNPNSLKNAIINVASVGLSLNPVTKLAYLVPRDGAIHLDVSYIGLTKLAILDGAVLWTTANIVREKDQLILKNFDEPPVHIHDPFAKDRGTIVGVFCVAKLIDGSFLTSTMTYDECIAIRNRTSGWKAHISKGVSSVWATDEGEMLKKTIIKRASKLWPKANTSYLEKAIDVINQHEGIDFQAEKIEYEKQKKISASSDLLNSKLGIEAPEENKAYIDSIKSLLATICKDFTDQEKRDFLVKKLGIVSFKEFETKDIDYLKDTETYLCEIAKDGN